MIQVFLHYKWSLINQILIRLHRLMSKDENIIFIDPKLIWMQMKFSKRLM